MPARKSKSLAIVHQPGAQLYRRFVEGIKERVRTAQLKAALAANAELVLHYWEVGREILANQKREGWGAKIIDRVKDAKTREFYIRETVGQGWSRSVLVHHLDTDLHKRAGKAPSNFALTLPSPQSDLAKELLKDPTFSNRRRSMNRLMSARWKVL
jgi:hypothetical protein